MFFLSQCHFLEVYDFEFRRNHQQFHENVQSELCVLYTETVPLSSVQFHFLIHLSPDEAGFLQARGILDLHLAGFAFVKYMFHFLMFSPYIGVSLHKALIEV